MLSPGAMVIANQAGGSSDDATTAGTGTPRPASACRATVCRRTSLRPTARRPAGTAFTTYPGLACFDAIGQAGMAADQCPQLTDRFARMQSRQRLLHPDGQVCDGRQHDNTAQALTPGAP